MHWWLRDSSFSVSHADAPQRGLLGVFEDLADMETHWHNLNEETVIKAGTPLAQLIAVPKNSLELEIRTDISKEELTINYILMNNTFVRNYAKIKSYFQGNQ